MTPHHDDRTHALLAAVDRLGYYPAAMSAALREAMADEPVLGFVVQHEPTFDRDEVRRHATVVSLTPSRLLVTHTDDNPGDDLLPQPYTATTTEAISLDSISSVSVTRMVANAGPEPPTAPAEAVLMVGWGGVKRVELEPAACADPECEADHGYSGAMTPEDLTVRISRAGDGDGAVEDLLRLAQSLSALTAGRS